MKLLDPSLEFSMLRTICNQQNGKERAKALAVMSEDWFQDKTAKRIYERIKALSASGRIPSWRELETDPGLAESAREAIKNRKKIKPLAGKDSIEAGLDQLGNFRTARKLFEAGQAILEGLDTDNPDVPDILDKTTKAVSNARMGNMDDDMLVLGKTDKKAIRSILGDKEYPLVPTGIKAFDKVNKGFLKGSLVTLAATTGGGKSTMSHNLAMNMAKAGRKVCIVSMEMSDVQVLGPAWCPSCPTYPCQSSYTINRPRTSERKPRNATKNSFPI